MPNFISEDDIEQAMVQRLQHLCHFDTTPGKVTTKPLFDEKRDKVFELTLDLAINHQKWAV